MYMQLYFKFGILELQIELRVTQNDVTLRVTNSIVKHSLFHFRVPRSRLKNI